MVGPCVGFGFGWTTIVTLVHFFSWSDLMKRMKTISGIRSSYLPSPLRLLAMVVVSGQLLMAQAFAANVYSTGFENPPFAPGSLLQGQDGWASGNPPFLNPNSATITDAIAFSGSQSLQIPGTAMGTFAETDPYAAVSPNAHVVDFDASAAGLPIVKVRADVRIDGPAELTPGTNFAVSIAAVPSEGRYSELVLSSDGYLYGLSSFGPEVLIESVDNPLNTWHSLEITINFLANAYTFQFDNTSFGPFPFAPSAGADVLLRGSIVAYALPDDPASGFARADYTARIDNFSITAVPEPQAFEIVALGVMGLVGLLFVRRTQSHRSDRFAPTCFE
jgi:hypothetical protein